MDSNTKICSKAMMIHFDSYENQIAKGKLQTLNYRYPFQFEGLDHLFLIIDNILDSISFPRRDGELRHITVKKEKDNFFPIIEANERCDEEEIKKEEVMGFHNHLIIIINRREHSSMQGTVILNGDTIYFRSVLELIHMLHEYLENHFQKGTKSEVE